ncbi:MAG TPA: transglutaminase-like domain-containing protein [Tepidisphaeraceae bacterium]|nr:transglutaminase-like domain-containing protein [Tepidisphaeraceae bacterium]
MTTSLPLCSTRDAFRLLAKQVPQIESPDALLYGSIAISMHQIQNVDPAAIDAKLQYYADVVRSRVRGSQPQAILAHLHEFLFEEEGFTGDTDDYYNPSNSYLPMTLETKRGLPITLALIYKIVAERLGLRVWGIGLPGHFLCGVDIDGSIMLIDPFNQGRSLNQDEALDRMRNVLGQEAECSEDLLAPVSNKHWLTRTLQNLLNIFGSSGHYSDVAAMLEMEMLLWPDQDRLQRDLALVLARIGMSQPASAWLNKYLRNNPDDPQKTDLRQLLQVLGT